MLEIRERLLDIRCMSVREKSGRPKLQLHHAPVEIERKFLVTNDEWKQLAVRSVKLRDGLIAAYKDRKVRVRIAGDDVATVASRDRGSALRKRSLNMRSRLPTPRGCSRPYVETILWRKSVSSSRTPGKLGMSTFTAAFSKASLLPKSSLSTRARS